MTIAEVSQRFGVSQDTLRYYERVKMIPAVNRKVNGQRDYTAEDCAWIELAMCMRSAGLPVEMMIDYLNLTQQGDTTLVQRKTLLERQREALLRQKEAIEATIERLNYKIGRYEEAIILGVLSWDTDRV